MSDDHSDQEDPLQQAQDTRRHDYSGSPSYFSSGRSDARRDLSPDSLNTGQDTYAEPNFLSRFQSVTARQDSAMLAFGRRKLTAGRTPAGRTIDQQRNNDLEAVKRFAFRRIRESGLKFARWTYDQQWTFIRSQREEKLRKREANKEGTCRVYFPGEIPERKDLDWLKKVFAAELQGCNQSLEGKHSIERSTYEAANHYLDQDDEEVIIKTEEYDENEHAVYSRHANHDHQHDFISRRAVPDKAKRESGELDTPDGNKVRSTLCSRCQTLEAVHHDDDPGGEAEIFADDTKLDQVVSSKITSRDSMTTPSITSPEWRQYWETNHDGYSALITPRN